MKKFNALLLVALFGLFFFIGQPVSVQGQIGQRYLWADSMSVSTIAADSTFGQRWETVTMWTDTVAIYFRAGAPDVTSWSSRDWIYLPVGSSITFGAATPLVRLEVKTVSGTGKLFMIGNKTKRQY